MASPTTSSTISNLPSFLPLRFSSRHSNPLPLPFSLSFPHSITPKTAGLVLCSAAKSQTGPVNKKRKKSGRGGGRADGHSKPQTMTLRRRSSDIDSTEDENEDEDDFPSASNKGSSRSQYQPTPLPKPPAGFVFDGEGKVTMASKTRLVTIVDPASNRPLECVVRRVFRSSKGDLCMLVEPADMPISIMRSNNFEGWALIGDEEIEAVIPTAAYALAKTHMHLVHSGFCYTARGGFAYTEDDVFNLGEDGEILEIVCFHQDGSYYMIYTPVDPLIFIAVKDDNDAYRLADDELLEDPAILSAIDEETEFNALAQAEEAALVDIMNSGGI